MLSPPDSAVAYVTGECCTPCLVHLWRKGIKKVVQRNSYGSQLVDEKMRKNKEILLAHTGMQVYTVEPDLTWLPTVLPI
jgi:deoxycytidylate deaminase